MIFLDSETCGLHGVPVIFQYAIDDGPVIIHECWNTPVIETIKLFKMFASDPDGIVGFNLAFDWFHVVKFFNMLIALDSRHYDTNPLYLIDELVEVEMGARDGLCIKPVKAMDLMLHARKGPYQSTMDRSDVRIKRVPSVIANQLARELEDRVDIKDIYFARRKDNSAEKWIVEDAIDAEGNNDPAFKNIVLRFKPSSALKALAVDALGKDVTTFDEVGINPNLYPDEYGYAPFAKATKRNWSTVIRFHVEHWHLEEKARQYAIDDVVYTRDLWEHFGRPESGDDDSELACMVAAVRWRGYSVDLDKIRNLGHEAAKRAAEAPRSVSRVKSYVFECLSPEERAACGNSTKKIVLEEIATFKLTCEHCSGDGCDTCDHSGEVSHPAAIRAQEVIDARAAEKEVDLYEKILLAGRFHASFKVIGALSSRMSGADGLNPQGIKSTKEVRSCFTLAWPNTVLSGGDFKAFEVVLAEASYDDPKLREALLAGKKIHALFALALFPDETYDSILASEGTNNDMYRIGKSAVFSQLYGGNENTLKERLGIPLELGTLARQRFESEYTGVGRKRLQIQEMFCSMRQPKGLGTKVEWHQPSDYMPSLFGFRRYFTLENQICKALFDLAENPPKLWLQYKMKVTRRDREQTAVGACRSALFGAAFSIQSSNMRAAANHEIQSSGAQITKAVQRKIWDIQPSGISKWLVQPMNIHDEILTVNDPSVVSKVEQVVRDAVESFRPKVPLIAIDWVKEMTTWAGKKG